MHKIRIRLFAFSTRSLCLSAAQNASLARCACAGDASYAADKQKKHAEKANKLVSQVQCKILKKQCGNLRVKKLIKFN
jgi:hypothetical protein